MKEENQTIIKALNMYGRVPEQWELLNEIERLHNIIKEVREEIQFIDIESYLIKHEDLKKLLEILDKENKNNG